MRSKVAWRRKRNSKRKIGGGGGGEGGIHPSLGKLVHVYKMKPVLMLTALNLLILCIAGDHQTWM